MKKEDLMIGDWYCWEAEGKQYHFQVEAAVFNADDSTVFNFQPVPITNEILDKNFKRVDEDWIIKGDACSDHVEIVFNSFGKKDYSVYICEEKIGFFVANTIEYNLLADIYYVHELQHLLKVLNIDTEIILC